MEIRESESLSRSGDVELQQKPTSALEDDLSLPGDATGCPGVASEAPSLNRLSSSSEDMQGLGHLDPKTTVLLRFEGMKSAELKIILLALYALLIVGSVSLIGLIVGKNLVKKDSTWLQHDGFSKASVGMATPCLALLLGILMWGSVRIWTAWKSAKHWPDPLILDAPLWYHAPKLLLWCAFQGTIISEAITGTTAHPHADICDTKSFDGACEQPLHKRIISIVWGVLCVAYFITYACYNARARIRLGKLPYNRFHTGNLLHSWQRRQGKWVMNFMVGSVLFTWYSSWNHCSGYFTTWLGIFPLQIVVTGATDVSKEPFFCLETALKLLTFSRVVYHDTTPVGAEKHVDVDSGASKIEELKLEVPVEACKSTQQDLFTLQIARSDIIYYYYYYILETHGSHLRLIGLLAAFCCPISVFSHILAFSQKLCNPNIILLDKRMHMLHW
ncbi:hypothetical protein COCOBI_08-0800 [Coccomyxa sp. Obi]|nr:hypothetical protein COCOBI_08-0800 [Coccomyxa sp. Obi]